MTEHLVLQDRGAQEVSIVAGPFDSAEEATEEAAEHDDGQGRGVMVSTRDALELSAALSGATVRDDRPDE